MRILRSILLIIVTLLCITAAVLLTIDGNLSRVIGRTAFDKGERLFPYSKEELNQVNWMRIKHINDKAEFRRLPNGVWWATSPWNDRMDPRAAAAILQFTHSTTIVDALPLNNTVKSSIKEFGLQSTPTEITLKHLTPEDSGSTMARYTLGTRAPWVVDDLEHKTTNNTTYLKTDYYGRANRICVSTGDITPLFKEGIRQLRDHRPLLVHPALPARISIKNKSEIIELVRLSPNSPWKITYPLELDTDPQMITVLLGALQKLTASRVHNPEDSILPELSDEQTVTVSISNFEVDEAKQKLVVGAPVVLSMFPTSDSAANNLVKATVSDRPAVFDLPYKSPQAEKGQSPSFAAFQNLPLTLNFLRSKNLTNLGKTPILGISLSSRQSMYPIIFKYRDGSKDTGTAASWTFSADGNPPAAVDEINLARLIQGIKEGLVDGFATDAPSDLKIYGLDKPIYKIFIALKPSPSQPDPLPTMLYFSKGADGSWYAQEEGKPTIFNIAPEFIQLFNMDPLYWRNKKLINFNRFDLKQLITQNVGVSAPLTLSYDSLDDTWKAQQGGKDVTVDINPNRANRYLQALEKIDVFQWLPYDDHRAWQALQNPTFILTMKLEGYTQTDHTMKNDQSATMKKESSTIQIDIVPVDKNNPQGYYYGKLQGMPEYFLLDDKSVKILTASLYEQ